MFLCAFVGESPYQVPLCRPPVDHVSPHADLGAGGPPDHLPPGEGPVPQVEVGEAAGVLGAVAAANVVRAHAEVDAVLVEGEIVQF